MKRVSSLLVGALVAVCAFAATAQAAAPGVSSLQATNVQGVSALLKGTVDPEGLATTYKFAYVDETGFNANGFAAAATTPSASIGSGTDPSPARAAIGGLQPNTTYHFRLTATNSSGSTEADDTFTTTAGFGLLADEEGFSAIAVADGGGAVTQAGAHPYRLDFNLGFRQGGDFEGQPGVPFPDGDVKDLEIDLPAGLFLNPKALSECTALQFSTPRVSPYAPSLSGESCSDKSQIGTVEVKTSRAGGETRRFGVFNLAPPPGVTAQMGFAAYGNPVILDIAIPQAADGSYSMTLRARNMPQSLDLRALKLSLWGTPWGVSHNGERGNCLN